jgi:hypothetical protein
MKSLLLHSFHSLELHPFREKGLWSHLNFNRYESLLRFHYRYLLLFYNLLFIFSQYILKPFLQCNASPNKWGQWKSYFRQVKSSQNTSSIISLSKTHSHTLSLKYTHKHEHTLSVFCTHTLSYTQTHSISLLLSFFVLHTKKCDYETNTICNNGLEYKEVQLDNIIFRLCHVFINISF